MSHLRLGVLTLERLRELTTVTGRHESTKVGPASGLGLASTLHFDLYFTDTTILPDTPRAGFIAIDLPIFLYINYVVFSMLTQLFVAQTPTE